MTLAQKTPAQAAPAGPPPKPARGVRLTRLVLGLFATLVLAFAWLVLPLFIVGQSVLDDVGKQIASERNAQSRSLGPMLTRYADGPGEAEVDVLFATDTYFRRTSPAQLAKRQGADRYHIFFVSEGVHVGELPQSLPRAELVVDGRQYPLDDAEGPELVDHHRSTTLRFARTDASGNSVIGPDTTEMTLILSNNYDPDDTPKRASWDLPIFYPEAEGAIATPGRIIAVSAGLVAAPLAPGFLLFTALFLATLAGLTGAPVPQRGMPLRAARRGPLRIAAAFGLGFTAVYGVAGAVLGQGTQVALLVSTYGRAGLFVSGGLVILIGLWIGIGAGAPGFGRLPLPAMITQSGRGGGLRAALLAVAAALASLLWLGQPHLLALSAALAPFGSPAWGAVILCVAAMAAVMPFFAAAALVSRRATTLDWLRRFRPQIGLASTIVIVGLGGVLIAGPFASLAN